MSLLLHAILVLIMDQIEEVKRKTDIVELISETVELKRAGRNFKGLCPFHGEKTPSFMVTPELQIFKCFGCSLGGDVYRYIQEFEKVDFPQALKILADRVGVKLMPIKGFTGYEEREEIYRVNYVAGEFYKYVLNTHKAGEKARVYLKQRKVREDAVKAFGLGYSPDQPSVLVDYLAKKRGYNPKVIEKAGLAVLRGSQYFDRFRGRVIFPLKDHLGNVLAFAGRVIEDRGEVAKYINSPDTLVFKKGRTLYGLDIARAEIKKAGQAIIVEGELDCISCWQVGIKNVVAIKGSALTEDQASLVFRFSQEVVLALDSDFAGDAAARRGLETMRAQGFSIKVASLGEYKDPDEMADRDSEGLKKALANAEEVHDFLINSVFKRHDVQTTEGKSKISREIAPILALIEDEIIKSHCVRVVAQRLQVPEEAVLSQVAKKEIKKEAKDVSQPRMNSEVRTRRVIFEEHLLSLLFSFNPSALQDEVTIAIFQSSGAKRIVEELQNQYGGKIEDFDPAKFAKKLPDELVELFANLLLASGEHDDPEFIKREIDDVKRNLAIMQIREEIEKLTFKIRDLESQGKSDEIVSFEEELTVASARLTQLESVSL